MTCTVAISSSYYFIKVATGALILTSICILALICYINPIRGCKRRKHTRRFISSDSFKKYKKFAGILSPRLGTNLGWARNLQVLKNGDHPYSSFHLTQKHSIVNTPGSQHQNGLPKVHFKFGREKLLKKQKFFERKFQSKSVTPTNIDLLNSRNLDFLRRCSSSQHINFKKVYKTQPMSTYSSLPNVCQEKGDEHEAGNYQAKKEFLLQNPNVGAENVQCVPSLQVNGEELFYEEGLDEVDEGQMQCILQYQKNKSLIILKSLAVQTIIPQYIPGFYIEVSVVPSHENQVWCSKVYPSVNGVIDVILNETFEIQANDEDVKYRSLVISVNPIIGNFKLYAETELTYLNTPGRREIYLGGFLKGVYTLT